MKRKKRPGSSVDDVYQVLYERIVQGTYPPGLRMAQSELAEELNTSRTPLREALNRLQANGLLVATNNRGMQVSKVQSDETEQLYAIRLLVEPSLIAAMVPDMTAADIQAMSDALDEMESAGHATRAYQEAHLKFHNVALARYPAAIRNMINSIYEKILRHQRLHFSRPQVPDDFTNVDRCFLRAIKARDSELARQWLEFHLIDAGLGLAFDVDMDHVPTSLYMAAKGVGITIDGTADRIVRPVSICWHGGCAGPKSAMQTINLKYTPGTAGNSVEGKVKPRTKRS
jgi:DNA-binding GntR family transcriptional regulator